MIVPAVLATLGLSAIGVGLFKHNTVTLKDGTTTKTHPASDWKPHPDATRENPFPDGVRPAPLPIPVPPPAPANQPPANMKRVPGIAVWAGLKQAPQPGDNRKILVVHEYVAGYKDPSYIGEGGGDDLPLVWLSADRSEGAVLWVQHPAYGVADFSAGEIVHVRNNPELPGGQ
jgi:hypothetical protein